MSHQDSFVDFVRLSVSAGDGGHGFISFRREKHVPFGGPDGGDGGKGGDVWIEADPTLLTLLDVKSKSHVEAPRGGHGAPKNMSGAGGEDRTIYVPVGTTIGDEDGTFLADLSRGGERWLAAAGGRGGAGNQHYPTSTNQAPRHAKDGGPGERRRLILELKLIADAGLVGLPNAGKSTLLRALTSATPRVAPYPFTTLHPNLGVMELEDFRRITLADIPGLIEGASRGVGLGDKFLRHIERTALLIHLVAPEPTEAADDEPDPESAEIAADLALDAYRMVRQELAAYSAEIPRKPEIVVLTKLDTLDETFRAAFVEAFVKAGLKPLTISAHSGEGLPELRAVIASELARLGRLPEPGEFTPPAPAIRPAATNRFGEAVAEPKAPDAPANTAEPLPSPALEPQSTRASAELAREDGAGSVAS